MKGIFEGKVAVVTGAASGIGRALSEELALQRLFERFRPMDVRLFAAKVLDQVARNRAIIVVPSWWKLVWWLERLSPELVLAIARRVVATARKELAGTPADAEASKARR